ncbi:elongation factor G ['Planchonia careya' phytoplasma]|nr:elongation factor G ['Planchonia careya' phytoplasma]MDO8030059.1 elongation factor G ['Planchonia careya' phytoplasma]
MGIELELDKIRNIGIMAHIDAGKTTTTERILFYTGKIRVAKETHEGLAQMDWMDQEKERGITITSAATTVFWNNCKINIIDTPGHIDFSSEVNRSLRVLDGGVVVIDAQAGVEPQTETVWRQATYYKVPRIVFVNKIDKLGANFENAITSLEKRLNVLAYAIQWPIGVENNFRGFVDLIEMQAWEYSSSPDQENRLIPIPEELKEIVNSKRQILIDKLASLDDELLNYLLENKPISTTLIKKAIRKSTLEVNFFPVLCGSALKNKGIVPLLNALVDFLPSPLDLPTINGYDKNEQPIIHKIDIKESFIALAFKVMTDSFGRLTFIRIYSGCLKAGSYVKNNNKNITERASRLLLMHANSRQDIKEAYAGDIVAVIGLKNTITGDTLTYGNDFIVLEKMSFPEPVLQVAVEPVFAKEQEKISSALFGFTQEDPTFKFTVDPESKQMIAAGMGDLHLDVLMERLKREFQIQVKVSEPQVAYRETLINSIEVDGECKHQTGGRGQYGYVQILFEPNPGKGFEFVNNVKYGAIPQNYIPAVSKGLQESLSSGIIAGYPLTDIKATLFSGAFHEVDSSEFAFKSAAAAALRKLRNSKLVVILEPIMKLELITPHEYIGNVIGDLVSRRGRLEKQENEGMVMKIQTFVPLAEMFKYSSSLRSNTQGRANFSMEFFKYEKAPEHIANKIIESRNK